MATFVPGSQIHLMTEAGLVPDSLSLEIDPSGQTGGGTASFTYSTGCPWPADVAPNQDPNDFGDGGEYFQTGVSFWDHCSDGGANELRTVNPRDGWADLVAYTVGAECGAYADGGVDPRCDQGEPYLDINDNGQYDGPNSPALAGTSYAHTGEPFFDFDGNGAWTAPNHRWDVATAIWTHTRVVWTATPVPVASMAYGNTGNNGPGLFGTDPPMTCVAAGCQLELPPMSQTTACNLGGPTYSLLLADVNGNCPTSDSPLDSITFSSAGPAAPERLIPLTQICTSEYRGMDPNRPAAFAVQEQVEPTGCGCLGTKTCPSSNPFEETITLVHTLDENTGARESFTFTVAGAFTAN